MNAPLDATHAECLVAQSMIRSEVQRLRSSAAAWRPAPFDPGWRPTRRESRAWTVWLAASELRRLRPVLGDPLLD